MKSILKATAVLGSVSAVTMLAGLASSKVYAVLLGPGGLGYMGLLQSLLGLTVMIVGMGVSTAVIRAGAKAVADGDERALVALRRGAWLLCLALGALGVACLVLFRVPVSRLMLGGVEHSGAVVLMGVGLPLLLGAGVQFGMLNAYHRVGDMARVGVLNALLGAGVSLLLVWWWRERGIAVAIIAGAVVNFVVTYYFVRGRVPRPRVVADVTRGEVWAAARSLLRFGAPFTASIFIGTGVLLLVPAMVLHALGQTEVGYYRAAAAISINYMGVLMTTMGQDYYPRVSAVSDQPAALVRLINEQLRLVLLLSGPAILGMLAIVPYLVPLIYTKEFIPTVELLEWQLIGDVFKFSAWTMGIVILARMGSVKFFLNEAFGGTLLLLTSWVGMNRFGLGGLGFGFALTAALYAVLCLLALRSNIGLRWTKENKLLFLLFISCMLIVRALPFVGLGAFRTPIALSLAVLTGSLSMYLIWGEVGGWKSLQAWGRATLGRGPADAPR